MVGKLDGALDAIWALAWIALFVILIDGIPGIMFVVGERKWLVGVLSAVWAVLSQAGAMSSHGGKSGLPGGGPVLALARRALRHGCPTGLPGRPARAGRVARRHPGRSADGAAVANPSARYWDGIQGATTKSLCTCLGVSSVVLLLAVSLVDVNLFSLNAMYANRLVRCYLGASRRKQVWKDRWGRDGQGWVRSTGGAPTGVDRRARERNENLVTGFDLNDDIPLYDLRFIKDLGQGRLNKRVVSYDGPYPLFNTTLNLVAGQELALKDRKGDSFVLSPWYCGSQTTGYQPLPDPAADPDPDLTLGRAVAVSGAAADPNMSAARSLAETMLMTVFNARLGCWLQNPSRVGGIKGQLLRWLEARDSIGTGLQAPGLAWLRSKLREQVKGETWRARGPSTGGLLLREFLGLTDESSALRSSLRRRALREPGSLRAGSPPLPVHRGL